MNAFSQGGGYNLSKFDKKFYHFGFLLSVNRSDFVLTNQIENKYPKLDKGRKFFKMSMWVFLIIECGFLLLGIFKVTPLEYVYYAFIAVAVSGVIGMTLSTIKYLKNGLWELKFGSDYLTFASKII